MTEPRSESTSMPAEAIEPLEVTDRSLVRRFQAGASDAATLLYFRYADHLYSLAAARLASDLTPRLDADDIVQSVFRTFFRRASQGQYDVPDGEDLWKLFLVIALNKIRSAATHHRATRRDVRRTPGLDVTEASTVELGDTRQNAVTSLRLTIEEILDSLPPSYRLIIERRIEGYQLEEIAALAGRSKRSVERILRDFREKLHHALQED